MNVELVNTCVDGLLPDKAYMSVCESVLCLRVIVRHLIGSSFWRSTMMPQADVALNADVYRPYKINRNVDSMNDRAFRMRGFSIWHHCRTHLFKFIRTRFHFFLSISFRQNLNGKKSNILLMLGPNGGKDRYAVNV